MTQTAAQIARHEVNRLYDAAEDARDYPEKYCKLRIKADQAMAAWRAEYPAEAAQEDDAAQQRRVQREVDFNGGFIARGLD
jgi:phage protein D